MLELIDYLVGQQVTTVVMEATSDYWKPFYYLMEHHLPVLLVNAKQARNIPGRKSDVSDAALLAQLAAHGLLRASFVPPEPIRELRDLTRARSVAARDRGRQVQRLEKHLESFRDQAVLGRVEHDRRVGPADARSPLRRGTRPGRARRPRPTHDAATRSRNSSTRYRAGSPSITHSWSANTWPRSTHAMVDALTMRIEEKMEPFRPARDALTTIPGVSTTVTEIILAETGADMAVFETAAHLASWAGVCPGMNETAGKVKSSATTHGNAYLKGVLGVVAMSASRSKGTYLAVRYRRIVARRGPVRAIVAIEHTILTASWHMLRNGKVYADLGPDHFTRLNPDRARNKAVRELENLGYQVVITPTAA